MINWHRKIGLVERFHSIQGEGKNAGRSALFIRLAGCNLDCVFADGSICDTPWRKSKLKINLTDVLNWASACVAHDSYSALSNPLDERAMVVLTGGEPTMSPAFDDLVHAFRSHAFYVAVETNGTIWRDTLPLCDWVTVSPKDNVHHANPRDLAIIHPEVMKLPPQEYRYVIVGDSEVPPYYPGKRHYLSPALLADGMGMEAQEGVTPEFVPGAVNRCIEIVKADPRWRLSLQTHKWLMVR